MELFALAYHANRDQAAEARDSVRLPGADETGKAVQKVRGVGGHGTGIGRVPAEGCVQEVAISAGLFVLQSWHHQGLEAHHGRRVQMGRGSAKPLLLERVKVGRSRIGGGLRVEDTDRRLGARRLHGLSLGPRRGLAADTILGLSRCLALSPGRHIRSRCALRGPDRDRRTHQ